MSPTTTARKSPNGTSHAPDQSKMLSEHRTLVAEYPVREGAKKAATSARIGRLEVDMLLSGLRMAHETIDDVDPSAQVDAGTADFVHWVKPSTYTQKFTTTPDELVSRIQGLRAIVGRTDLPDVVIANAEAQLTRELDNAQKRGIQIPAQS